ncbi:MAG: caspase family protein [Gammaproteobacteria bacterium]|nr:caspase family protein [Gammaproteobacteria bacterium]
MKYRNYYIVWLLIGCIALFACRQTPGLHQKSGANQPLSGSASSNRPAVQPRRCFSAEPQNKHAQGSVFLLAAGSNTGELTKTNSDARRFGNAMRKRFSIPAKQACVIENVSKKAFLKGLQALSERVKPQDMAIIYYSGHGMQVADDDGDEGKWDGLDEGFVVYDAYNAKDKKTDPANVLRDDVFVRNVNKLQAGRLLTVIDACYSGGMYLAPKHPGNRWAGGRPKALPPAFVADTGQKGAARSETLKGLLFSAATEGELAFETNKQGGVFTWYFSEALQQMPEAELITVFHEAKRRVRKLTEQRQHPQAKGHLTARTGGELK